MKTKNIVSRYFILNIILILFLNIQLYSKKTEKKSLYHYIPSSASIIVSLNIDQLKTKGDFNSLRKIKELRELEKIVIENEFPNFIENTDLLGINLKNDIYIFNMKNNTKIQYAIICVLDNAKTFLNIAEKLRFTIKERKSIYYHHLAYNEDIVLAWSDDVAVILPVSDNNFDTIQYQEILNEIFSSARKNTYNNRDKSFSDLQKQKKDISVWVNYSDLLLYFYNMQNFQNIPNLGTDNIEKSKQMYEKIMDNYKNIFLTVTVNFQKGKITSDSHLYFAKNKNRELYKNYMRKLRKDMIQYINQEKTYFIFFSGFNMEYLTKFLSENDELMKNYLQNSMKESKYNKIIEILNSFKGDITASIYPDPYNNASPKFSLGLTINNKEKLTQLLSDGVEKGVLVKGEKDYALKNNVDTRISFNKDVLLVHNDPSLESIFFKEKNTKINTEIQKLAKEYSMLLYINLQEVINKFLLSKIEEKNSNNEIFKNHKIKDLYILSKYKPNDTLYSKIELNIADNTQNSLKLLTDYIMKYNEEKNKKALQEKQPLERMTTSDKSIYELQKELKEDPDNADVWNDLGVKYYNINLHQAMNFLEKAISLDQKNFRAHNNIGVVYEELKYMKKAEQSYKKALEINSDYTDALYNLGTLYLNSDKLDKAEKYLRKITETKPEYVHALHNLGIVYQKKKKYKKSIFFFKKAIKLKEYNAPAYYNIGISYINLDEYKKAEKHLLETIKIDSNHFLAHKHLGNTYYHLKDLNNAYKYWKIALLINPDDEDLKKNIKTLKQKGYK